MSRSINQIQTEIINSVYDSPELNGLTSSSKTAIWRAMTYVVAVAIFVFEGLQDVFKSEIEEIASNAIGGSLRWYKVQTLKWQYNHTLVENGASFGYEIDDETARIVTQVACVETGRQITVKVAKGATGSLEALSSAEKASLLAYLEDMKVAGTSIVLTSEDADALKIYYRVYYDAIKDLSIVQADVESVINNALQTLPFNAELKLSAITDKIQVVSGVTDVAIVSASAKYGANPYVNISRKYQSNAGYLSIDAAFPLSSTITYEAE